MQYKLIRSRRRKKSLSLKVDYDGQVIVRAPTLAPKLFIDRFVKKNNNWINKRKKEIKNTPKKSKLNAKQASKYIAQLQIYINKQAPQIAKKIGVQYKKLQVKNITSYWGNCTGNGMISFNCRLATAPTGIINYIIIHELCHLKIRGHNKKFWALVKKFDPHHKTKRKWLNNYSKSVTIN